ncbi:hypothetical protein E4T56_gene6195, partial [Termitomyces sp. T112]
MISCAASARALAQPAQFATFWSLSASVATARRCKMQIQALDRGHRKRHLGNMIDDTPDSLIPYDEIVQEALRAVVGRVLGQVANTGGSLPGNHHFYITFKTQAPGVDLPAHLKTRFPDEMTIVLQNKFWDLTVPATLVFPFAALTAFVDPPFVSGFQFQPSVHDLDPEHHDKAA